MVNRLRVNNRVRIRFFQEPFSLALEVNSNKDNDIYMDINSDTKLNMLKLGKSTSLSVKGLEYGSTSK